MRTGTLAEYNQVTATAWATKRIMTTKRTMTVEWKVKGVLIAEKTEIRTGKKVSTQYMVNSDYVLV